MPNGRLQFWVKWKNCLAEDIIHERHEQVISEQSMQIVLQKIHQSLQNEGLDIHVNCGFPWPDPTIVTTPELNRVLMGETGFNAQQLQANINEVLPILYPEQMVVFHKVITSENKNEGKSIFMKIFRQLLFCKNFGTFIVIWEDKKSGCPEKSNFSVVDKFINTVL
ncbi:Hypothetical predicted protein [Octopus vulgaris]|uniref:Uncharacterized protein n=1 Tax=Octopus vulgaris TaxID=6645 RepID=A0AA36B079_OCTVU|nr:Hypothetical predicted protein [Octopus vulgaris]